MPSASLKRGRVTARVGRLEALPGGSEALKQQIADKERLLAKLCSTYEHLVTQSKERKKGLQEVKRSYNEALAEAMEIEGLKEAKEDEKEEDIVSSAVLGKKREKAEEKLKELSQKAEKAHEKLQNLLKKRKREIDEKAERSQELARLEREAKELAEATLSDEREAKELEMFITRLAKTLFERQRKLEEMQIHGHGSVGVEGVEKKLREERRRLLKEKELIDGKFPRIELPEDEPEEESPPGVNLAEIEAKLSKMAGKWSEKMDRLLESDIRLAEGEGLQSALETRISQVEAATKLLNMKKDSPMYATYMQKLTEPPMYAAYSQKVGEDGKAPPSHGPVSVPDFGEHLMDFVGNVSAFNRNFLADDNLDVDTSYWEKLKEVEGMRARRRQLVQDGEKWARQEIQEELSSKLSIVEALQRQADSAEHVVQRKAREIEAKKNELENEEKKREQAEKRRKQRQLMVEVERRKAESHGRKQVEKRQSVVEGLRQRISEAEAVRRRLRSQCVTAEREATDAKAALHALSASLHDDRPKLRKSVEEWKSRVEELNETENELRRMLEEALRTNAEAREQLTIVKPYQAEQLEMDDLVEEERHLDALLADAGKRREAQLCFPDLF